MTNESTREREATVESATYLSVRIESNRIEPAESTDGIEAAEDI